MWLHSVRAREVGDRSHVATPRSFQRQVGADPSFISRLRLSRVLKAHTGCVNTVGWSENGELLISGSDDTSLCIWNYHENGALKQQFATGHTANIFCARFVPLTDNRRVVSCAGDNQIRVFDIDRSRNLPAHSISSSFRTNAAALPPYRVYDAHDGRTKKIAFDSERPDSVFFSASEDGTVRMFDMRTPFAESQRGRVASRSNYGVVVDLRDSDETIEIYSVSVSGNLIAAAGADPHVRIYDVRSLRDVASAKNTRPLKYLAPPALSRAAAGRPDLWTSSRGHITGISFRGKEIVASYIGDAIYLFDVDENLDVKAAKPIMSGLGPAGLRELRDGKKTKGKEKASYSEQKKKRKHKAKKSEKKGNKRSKHSNDDAMMVDSDDDEMDDDVVADDADDSDSFGPPDPRQVFGDEGVFYQRKFTGHCSIRTIKECSFFGSQQEYIVSGSDCGHIFIWDKSSGKIVTAMKGDSAIVNSIQGHPHDGFVLASSGIESNVKLWQPGDEQTKKIDIDELVQMNNETLADNSRTSAGIPLSVIRHILRGLRAQAGDDEDDESGDVTLDDLMRSMNPEGDGDDEDQESSSAAGGADEDEGDKNEGESEEEDDSESQSRRRRTMCRQS
eukprot:TRINITY_DN1147_c0_g1_i1.p1 TRINITY_DN1147_c0_g1~~TRINITY_DN1147_c0_g1_i1.p1  ORF type:complete len:618 (-),score=103.64 TRINITY_DN1147_c0_g1_i1:53-1906(-)